jgi:hypothetical protein
MRLMDAIGEIIEKMSAAAETPFPALHNAQFMALSTYRRSGAPVLATVWFAEEDTGST